MVNKVCAFVGCKKGTRTRFCESCTIKDDARNKARYKTGSRKAPPNSKRFYSSAKWKALRARKIQQSPLCEHCTKQGYIKAAYDVDHIVEIKDDSTRSLDITNLQALCRSCHLVKTNRERKNRAAL